MIDCIIIKVFYNVKTLFADNLGSSKIENNSCLTKLLDEAELSFIHTYLFFSIIDDKQIEIYYIICYIVFIEHIIYVVYI